MIGGNQLAFTLLGVRINEKTRDVEYLILDPHYIGEDDYNSIVNKQCNMCGGYKSYGCCWRDKSLFNPSIFYSLCLPQRPIIC